MSALFNDILAGHARLQAITATHVQAADKHARVKQWIADIKNAQTLCAYEDEHGAQSGAMHAASVIKCLRALSPADAVVILAALATHTDVTNNLHLDRWQDLVACVSDTCDTMLAEVVREREGGAA